MSKKQKRVMTLREGRKRLTYVYGKSEVLTYISVSFKI